MSSVIQNTALAAMNNEPGEPNTWLVVLAGVAIVFLGMILLTAILYIMSAVGKKNGGKKKQEDAPKAAEPVKEEIAEETADSEEEELYAVIAAAIAAYNEEHGRTSSSIKAREIKRLGIKAYQSRKNG